MARGTGNVVIIGRAGGRGVIIDFRPIIIIAPDRQPSDRQLRYVPLRRCADRRCRADQEAGAALYVHNLVGGRIEDQELLIFAVGVVQIGAQGLGIDRLGGELGLMRLARIDGEADQARIAVQIVVRLCVLRQIATTIR